MHKSFCWVLTALLFSVANLSSIQAQGPDSLEGESPLRSNLLWQIDHPDWKSPSYIFGTIHLIGEADFFWPTGLDSCFGRTKQMALEVDMDDPSQMGLMLTGSMMKDRTKLSSLIDSAAFQRLNTFFQDSIHMPVTMLQQMKPMLLSSMFYPLMVEGELKSYETELLKKAKQADMEILGLESMADQLGMLDSIPYIDQAEGLVAMVDSFSQHKAQLRALVDVYVSQDIQALYELMSAEEDMAEHEDVMLSNRNQRWIPVMMESSGSLPTFYAVGAGHLAGEQGVLNLLNQAGCTLRPIQ